MSILGRTTETEFLQLWSRGKGVDEDKSGGSIQ